MSYLVLLIASLIAGAAIVAWQRKRTVKKIDAGMIAPSLDSPTEGDPAAVLEVPAGLTRHQTISLAIKKKCDVKLVYADESGAQTMRRVTPQTTGKEVGDGRVRFRDVLFSGFCHLRQDIRHFRYDRIVSITVLAPVSRGHKSTVRS